jgi:hypothetical protein
MESVETTPKLKYSSYQIRRAPAMIALGGMLLGWSLASIFYLIVPQGAAEISKIAAPVAIGLLGLATLMASVEAVGLRTRKTEG